MWKQYVGFSGFSTAHSSIVDSLVCLTTRLVSDAHFHHQSGVVRNCLFNCFFFFIIACYYHYRNNVDYYQLHNPLFSLSPLYKFNISRILARGFNTLQRLIKLLFFLKKMSMKFLVPLILVQVFFVFWFVWFFLVFLFCFDFFSKRAELTLTLPVQSSRDPTMERINMRCSKSWSFRLHFCIPHPNKSQNRSKSMVSREDFCVTKKPFDVL